MGGGGGGGGGKYQAWDKISDDNGSLLHGTKKIQQRQVEFYESLYKSQDLPENGHVRNTFLQNIKTKLSEKSYSNLNKDISLTELSSARFKMKNNKSPGQDGICEELYKMYWNDQCQGRRIRSHSQRIGWSAISTFTVHGHNKIVLQKKWQKRLLRE